MTTRCKLPQFCRHNSQFPNSTSLFSQKREENGNIHAHFFVYTYKISTYFLYFDFLCRFSHLFTIEYICKYISFPCDSKTFTKFQGSVGLISRQLKQCNECTSDERQLFSFSHFTISTAKSSREWFFKIDRLQIKK